MYFSSQATVSALHSQRFSYSPVREFVISDTDENGENWYMANNNQFTVFEYKFKMERTYG